MKLDFRDKAQSKVGSKDNIKHQAGGGDKKVSFCVFHFFFYCFGLTHCLAVPVYISYTCTSRNAERTFLLNHQPARVHSDILLPVTQVFGTIPAFLSAIFRKEGKKVFILVDPDPLNPVRGL